MLFSAIDVWLGYESPLTPVQSQQQNQQKNI